MKKLTITSLICTVCLPLISLKADVYVVPGGTGSTPYDSWTNAAPDIQTAVNAASINDTIFISNGVYSLVSKISLTKSLTLQGVPFDNPPVIDGNGTVKCLEASDGTTVVLNNLKIINGNSTQGAGARLYDGGVYDCFFSNNITGSALFITGSGTVERTSFVTNSTTGTGAAIVTKDNPFLLIRSCGFTNNVAKSSGGAVSFVAVGDLLMTDCILEGNVSLEGNGGAVTTSTVPANGKPNRIEFCQFIENRAGADGGGTAQQGGGLFLSGVGNSYTVSDCLFSNNVAANAGGGVGLGCPSVLQRSLIINNRQAPAVDNANRGGGGISFSSGGQIINCRIEGNSTVYQGGGVYATGGHTLLRNCLILNNTSTRAGYGGGGVRLRFSNNVVESSSIVSNYAVGSGGGIDAREDYISLINSIIYSNNSDSVHKDVHTLNRVIAFTNCCLSAPLPANIEPHAANNLVENPLFADADYRLAPQSPCINAGFTLPWMATAKDLDDRARLDIQSQTPDIGCYEYHASGALLILR